MIWVSILTHFCMLTYYQPVYTLITFDVTQTNKKLKSIMEKYKMKNIYDLLLSFAVDVPYNMAPIVSVIPFLKRDGEQVRFTSVDKDRVIQTNSYTGLKLPTYFLHFQNICLAQT